MVRVWLASLCLALGLCGAAAAAPRPWLDKSLPPDARADLLQAKMTREEQLLLLKGYFGANTRLTWIKPAPKKFQPLLPGSAGFVPGIARLGIPPLRETDAGAGIGNKTWMRAGDTATAFPSGIANAATWNPDVVFAGGAGIGAEARARGYNVVLAGGINLAREPRGGRTFEYAGEDPLLAGTIVGAQIAGIQSRHVISTIKHFVLNASEIGRGVLSANIGEAPLRESDLLAFEIGIERGAPGAVMCGYNRVNGVYACENELLLNKVLKHDWAYPGFVLSDWGGVHSTAASANAGLDQESASGFDKQEFFGAPFAQALADGSIGEARLRDMVHRILRSMFANGLMDDPPKPRKTPLQLAAAQRSAEEAIVLLKNGGGLLPLARAAQSIVVIGAHADIGMLSGGGSSQVVPTGHVAGNEFYPGGAIRSFANGARIVPVDPYYYDPPSPAAAIAAAAPQATVRFLDEGPIDDIARQAASADIVIVFAEQWMAEDDDMPGLSLPGKQNALIAAVAAANPHTIVVLETGGPVTMPWLDAVPAVLEAWYPGSGGAAALTRILFGDVNPSGRLPITFPSSEDQLVRATLPDGSLRFTPFDIDYAEGADVGYRWFERQHLTPLFPFGYGLSYTTFAASGFAVDGGDAVTAHVTITNTGARAGAETAQLYATPPDGGPAQLVGFTKIALAPGESRTVSIAAEPRLLARFDAAAGLWRIAGGSYTLSIRRSATDIVASAPVTLAARDIKP